MDVLVMLEEHPEHSPMLARVDSVPRPLDSERPSRDVVTLYGAPSPESLALALAAAVESHRAIGDGSNPVHHLGIWPERGAVGDAAWRDVATGQLVMRDVDIPLDALRQMAGELLVESGALIRRLVAGLSMPDWPEGARRAITFSMTPVGEAVSSVRARGDALLDLFREGDGLVYEFEGD